MYVSRESFDCPEQILVIDVGIRKADGAMCLKQTSPWIFEDGRVFRFPNILARSELLQRQGELMTSGALTIVCTLTPPPTVEMNTFSRGLKKILFSKEPHDVTLHVKEELFAAHINILAESSSVFNAMFQHEMSEKNSGVVKISDCDPGAFEDFLFFLYTRRADVTSCNVYHLYMISHKYDVKELKSLCVAYMMKNLTVDNLCDVAALGDQYSDGNLNWLCKRFFKKNVQSNLLTSQWKSLLKENYLVAFKLLKDIASKITVEDEDE